MADHRIETKLLLRYATYSQWMSSDVILLPGEAAVAYFPRLSTLKNTDDVPDLTPPAIGIKIGDGHSYFDELPWVQAVAADVYSWAKASEKQTYAATEITGLTEFINSIGGGGSGGGTDSASYRIIYDNANNKYILQYFDSTQNDWVNTSSEINLASILNRINTIERWANGARSNLGNIEVPIAEYIYEEVLNYVNSLDYADQLQPHQFVTSVVETNGVIAVTRSTISAADISGVFDTSQGGTGITRVEDDELLVGSTSGNLQVRRFSTTIDEYERGNFVTAGAVIDYVLSQTAGLTGAMHFIGEATVPFTEQTTRIDPQISGYNFRNAQPGDVILANNAQEYVWTGDNWRLLGDEGSYAIKGSIVNTDIAEEANIAQSKIADLDATFDTKVTKVEGKDLSTNDYTNEDKDKLTNIDAGAQVNTIEHVFFNDEEVSPRVVSGLEKSIDLHFNGMTQEQSEKLESIETGAQVNTIETIKLNNVPLVPDNQKAVNIEVNEITAAERAKLATVAENAQPNVIEHIYYDGEEQTPDQDKTVYITSDPHTEHINKIEQIFINGTEYRPDAEKAVRISLDQAALNLNVLEGARYPTAANTYADVEITNKKLELSRIAATGDVAHLLQTADTYIILDCGSSTEVI